MYQSFYGLDNRPFELTPDVRYLFLTPTHSEALTHLEYGITHRKGVVVLTGEAGAGKTLLVAATLARLDPNILCIPVSNPLLNRAEFYEYLATAIGYARVVGQSKARFLVKLTEEAKRRHELGGTIAIVIDEAQCLSLKLLEEIRLLANIETKTEKLLQIVLVGQPELSERLNDYRVRQFKQRIALRCVLGPMTLRETAAYIAGRIRLAGGDAVRVFTREAVRNVHERSRGIPRIVNVLCDNALVTGFALGTRPVDQQIVLDVCKDFDLREHPAAAAEVEVEVEAPSEPAPAESAERRPLFGGVLLGARR
jgi:general secretion pathway protein A